MRVSFTSENKIKDSSSYPKLSLERGERARVSLVEPEPMMRFVHNFNMPVVVDGKILTETRTGKRGDYEVPKQDFAGQHLCLGREDKLVGTGSDPEKCISCEAFKTNPEWFNAPKRRFAQHLVKYKLQPGKFQVQVPFQVELLLWVYSDMRFDQIVDIAEEHGDPRGLDLNLGPCEGKLYQKFDINVASKCEWLSTDERKALVVELMKLNQCGDIEAMIGKRLTAGQIQMDIDRVMDRWGEVGAVDVGDANDTARGVVAGASELDDLLGASKPRKDVTSLDEILGESKPKANPKPKAETALTAQEITEAEADRNAAEARKTIAETGSFDDILAGL